MSKAHPGFKGAVASVQHKEGLSHEAAERVIGYGKAHASAAARKKNPRLNRVGGEKHRGHAYHAARRREHDAHSY